MPSCCCCCCLQSKERRVEQEAALHICSCVLLLTTCCCFSLLPCCEVLHTATEYVLLEDRLTLLWLWQKAILVLTALYNYDPAAASVSAADDDGGQMLQIFTPWPTKAQSPNKRGQICMTRVQWGLLVQGSEGAVAEQLAISVLHHGMSRILLLHITIEMKLLKAASQGARLRCALSHRSCALQLIHACMKCGTDEPYQVQLYNACHCTHGWQSMYEGCDASPSDHWYLLPW